MRTSSTSAAKTAPDGEPDAALARNRQSVEWTPSKRCVSSPPGRVAADRDERAVGEVEDAHEPVDERQAGRDQEVHRAEAEAGDREQDERAHACAHAQQPLDELRLREQLLRVARVHDAALVEHDRVARDPPHDAEVLLDEQDGRQLGEPLEHARDVGDERRREALRRLVDEQHAVVVQQRARDRDHLLLSAGERARALPEALLELREELVDEVVARLRVALREAEVLGDGEAGEDVAILGDVADAQSDDPIRRLPHELLVAEPDGAVRADEAEDRAERRRLADAVAAEQRRDPALGNVERDALQHVGLAEVDVQVANGEERPRGDGSAHSSSPR